MTRIGLFGVAAALLLGSAAAGEVKVPRSLAVLTAERVSARTSVTADPLEFEMEVSTRDAHRGGRAADGTVASDAYLVAAIDRRTRAVRYQLRHDLRYAGPRRDYGTIHYLDRGQLRRAPLSSARHGDDECPNSDFNGVCFLAHSIAFDLPEPLLREIAASPAAAWPFKLKEAAGRDVTGMIARAEVEGLLLAVARLAAGEQPIGSRGL